MVKKPNTPATSAPTTSNSAPAQPWVSPAPRVEIPKPDAPAVGDTNAPAVAVQNPPANAQNSPAHADTQPETPLLSSPPQADRVIALLHEHFRALAPEEHDEFEAFLVEKAAVMVARLLRGREARAMEVNIIDGTKHFGNRVFSAAKKGS